MDGLKMSKVNRILALLAAAVLAVGMLLTGCPGNTTSPTPTPTPSESPVATPSPTLSPSPSPDNTVVTNVFNVTLTLGPGESPVVGKPAPGFKFTGSDGSTVSLSDFRGKPVMLNFWNISCQPCYEEMPYLQKTYEDWTDKGLVFFSIDVGDRFNSVTGYVGRNKLTFPVLVDGSGELALGYGIWSFPTTMLIDRDGTILKIQIGAFSSPQQIETKFLSLVFPELAE